MFSSKRSILLKAKQNLILLSSNRKWIVNNLRSYQGFPIYIIIELNLWKIMIKTCFSILITKKFSKMDKFEDFPSGRIFKMEYFNGETVISWVMIVKRSYLKFNGLITLRQRRSADSTWFITLKTNKMQSCDTSRPWKKGNKCYTILCWEKSSEREK